MASAGPLSFFQKFNLHGVFDPVLLAVCICSHKGRSVAVVGGCGTGGVGGTRGMGIEVGVRGLRFLLLFYGVPAEPYRPSIGSRGVLEFQHAVQKDTVKI